MYIVYRGSGCQVEVAKVTKICVEETTRKSRSECGSWSCSESGSGNGSASGIGSTVGMGLRLRQ